MSLCHFGITSIQFLSLQDLYLATQGENWKWRKSNLFGIPWNFTGLSNPLSNEDLLRPCGSNLHWQGLTCISSKSSCSIQKIELYLYGVNGTLPTSIGNFNELQFLNLESNNLYGPIPWEIGNLIQLESFQISLNNLTGSIPSSLGLLTGLNFIDLSNNHLSGTLTCLQNLTQLSYLNLFSNYLTGTIDGLVNLNQLVDLSLSNNFLSGTLNNVQNLTQLSIFYIFNNLLTGTLDNLTKLVHLTQLFLYNNHLSGQLDSLQNMNHLTQLYLQNNQLTGTIDSLRNLNQLTQLLLFSNHLTGTIDSVYMMNQLTQLSLDNNHLTGTLDSLQNLTLLTILYLYHNYLTGPIDSLRNLIQLTQLCLDGNHLSGPLDSLQNMNQLTQLYLNDNHLSGTLDSLINLNQLTQLYLYDNYFSGTLESLQNMKLLAQLRLYNNFLSGPLGNFQNMNQLTQLYLNNNFLSGTLPPDLFKLSKLYTILIHQNSFSGSIVIPTLNGISFLTNFIAFENRFSGPIPSELFSFPLIEVISLSENCFSGILPSCSSPDPQSSPSSPSSGYSQSLISLDLSDLSSGLNCRYFPFSFLNGSGFFPKKFLTGALPSCLLDLPHLHTLYVAGNGLTGQIQVSSDWSCEAASIQNLILSQNLLSGTIPGWLQTCGSVKYLDLSLNRLSGTLESNLMVSRNSTVFFDVSVNRLSGPLPLNLNLTDQGLTWMLSNVLEGNMFIFSNADLSHALDMALTFTLPNGSSNLNTSLYFSLSLFVLVFIFSLFISSFRHFNKNHQILSLFLRSLTLDPTEKGDFILDWWISNRNFQLLSCWGLGSISLLFIIMKEIPLLSEEFSTQSYQYAWVLSVSFLHGWLPCLLLGVIVMVAMLLMLWEFHTSLQIHLPKKQILNENENDTQSKTNLASFFLLVCLLLFNICFMGFLNGLYIIFLLQINTYESIFQILLGVFKSFWNDIISKFIKKLYPNNPHHWMWFGIFFRVFNLVIVTYLTGVLTESSCLYPLFVSHPINSFSFNSLECTIYAILTVNNFTSIPRCTILREIPISLPPINPPFIYHFQCASSLVVNYTPVMLYSVVASLLWQCVKIFVILVAERRSLNLKRLPNFMIPKPRSVSVFTLVQLMSNLSLLLTYGLACPYLGLLLLVAMRMQFSIYYFLSKLSDVHHLILSRESNQSIEGIGLSDVVTVTVRDETVQNQDLPISEEDKLHHKSSHNILLQHATHYQTRPESAQISSSLATRPNSARHPLIFQNPVRLLVEDFQSILPGCLMLISLVVGGFWSLQLFDMVGDVYGLTSGLVVLFVYFGSISVLGVLGYAILSLRFSKSSNSYLSS